MLANSYEEIDGDGHADTPLLGPTDTHDALLRYHSLDLGRADKRAMDETVRGAKLHNTLSSFNSLPLVAQRDESAGELLADFNPAPLTSSRRRTPGQTVSEWEEKWAASGTGHSTSVKEWTFAPLMQPRPRVIGRLPGFPATWRGALVRVGNYETALPGESKAITASDQTAILRLTRDCDSPEECLHSILAQPPWPKRLPKLKESAYKEPDARGRFNEHPDSRGRYFWITLRDIYFATNPVVPPEVGDIYEECSTFKSLAARSARILALAQRATKGALHMQGGMTGTAVALMGVWAPFASPLPAYSDLRHALCFRLQRPWIDGIEASAPRATRRLLALSSVWKEPPVMYRLHSGVWAIGDDDAMTRGLPGQFSTTKPDRGAMTPLGLTWRFTDPSGRTLAELALAPIQEKAAAKPDGWFWWSWNDLEARLTFDALAKQAATGEAIFLTPDIPEPPSPSGSSPSSRGVARRKSNALQRKQSIAWRKIGRQQSTTWTRGAPPPTMALSGACEYDPVFGLMGNWDLHGTHNDAPLYRKRPPYAWSPLGSDPEEMLATKAKHPEQAHAPELNPLFLYMHRDGSWHIHGAKGMCTDSEGYAHTQTTKVARRVNDAMQWRRNMASQTRAWRDRVRGRTMKTLSASRRPDVVERAVPVALRKNTVRDTATHASVRRDPISELVRLRWSSFGRNLPSCRCRVVEVEQLKAEAKAMEYAFEDQDREAVRRIAHVLDSDHSGHINDHELRILGGVMRSCPASRIPLGARDAPKHMPVTAETPTCQRMLAVAEASALALAAGVDGRAATRANGCGETRRVEVETEHFVEYSEAALEAMMISLGTRACGDAMRAMLRWLERELAAHFGAAPNVSAHYDILLKKQAKEKERHDMMTPNVHPKPHHGFARTHPYSKRIDGAMWNHPLARVGGRARKIGFGHSTWDPREGPSGQSTFHPAEIVSGNRPPQMDASRTFIVPDGRATLRGDGQYVEPILATEE
jgi:hypothetical protein